jgi:biotin carboxyl carrier protein
MFPAEAAALLRGEAVVELLGDEPSPDAAADAGVEVVAAPISERSGDPEAAPGPEAPSPAQEVRDLVVEVDGEQYAVRVIAPPGTFSAGGAAITDAGPSANGSGGVRPAVSEGTVVAPMQGLILRVPVAPGDAVALGDVVAVLEAMKMQNDIIATRAGTVREVYVSEGTVVSPNDPLVLVE